MMVNFISIPASLTQINKLIPIESRCFSFEKKVVKSTKKIQNFGNDLSDLYLNKNFNFNSDNQTVIIQTHSPDH